MGWGPEAPPTGGGAPLPYQPTVSPTAARPPIDEPPEEEPTTASTGASAVATRAARLRARRADVRDLGIRLPLRVAVEGAHRFGQPQRFLAHRAASPDRSAPPVPLVPAGRYATPPVGSPARDRLAVEVDRILAGEVRLFDRWWPVGRPGDTVWNADPRTGVAWPLVPWPSLATEGPKAVADPKWVWELGRLRHLVHLARAVQVGERADLAGAALDAGLAGWFAQVPPELGPHWYSNLEVALRACAFDEIVARAGRALAPARRTAVAAVQWQAGRHLVAELPRSLSSHWNNHVLGDALGLSLVGRSFPGARLAALWTRVGDALVRTWAARSIDDQGATVEDSIGYHRFVLDMLVVRIGLGDAPDAVRTGVARMGAALAALGAVVGPVPQIGDWDAGRVLQTTEADGDLAGVVHLAAAVGGSGAGEGIERDAGRAGDVDRGDESAWYLPPPEPSRASVPVPTKVPTTSAAVAASETEGGVVMGRVARIARGDLVVTLKGRLGASHEHADLTSVAVALADTWIVGDPGTAHYNEPLAERDAFRVSAAHAVVRVDGADQLVPGRQFRWQHRAEGWFGPPAVVGDHVVAWCGHDAYRRLDVPVDVVRAVVVGPDRVLVVDVLAPHGPGDDPSWALTLPLGPDVEIGPAGGDALAFTASGRPGRLHLPSSDVTLVREGPVVGGGWWSPTYGALEPATRVSCSDVGRVVAWAVAFGDPDDDGRAPGPTATGPATTDGVADAAGRGAVGAAWGDIDVVVEPEASGAGDRRWRLTVRVGERSGSVVGGPGPEPVA